MAEQTRAEQTLDALQTAIVRGDLLPGAKLNEPELASRYGISRGPLREAIRALQARRLVTVTRNAGARVVALDREQLRALYETREALEGMAARLAAERLPPAQVDELRRLLDRHEDMLTSDGEPGYYQAEGGLTIFIIASSPAAATRCSRTCCSRTCTSSSACTGSSFPGSPGAQRKRWQNIGICSTLLRRRTVSWPNC